jgi:LPXTG-motif cell wall-anchored protein
MKRHKSIIIAAMLLLSMAVPSQAQVFIMEEDEGPDRNVLGAKGTWNNVIVHGSLNDQTNYTPIGGGLLIMTALGGLYLMNKRKNEKK